MQNDAYLELGIPVLAKRYARQSQGVSDFFVVYSRPQDKLSRPALMAGFIVKSRRTPVKCCSTAAETSGIN